MTLTQTRTRPLLERLAGGDVLISDGATGTYLQAKGLEPGGCPELMNVEQPEVVRRMAAEYFAAGSDIVLTNSFGGNKFGLKRYGFEDRVRDFNRLAAEHARSQTPEGRYTVGSVGPTGVFMEPLGEVGKEEMYDAFAEQITALEEGGADGVVIETMISVDEAEVAIKAARENTNLTVMSTLTFDKGPRGWFTMMGDTPEAAVKRIGEAGAQVVGTNCGNGVEAMIDLVTRIRAATDRFLIVHSNAGIPEIIQGRVVYPETPEFMAPRFKALADLGVSIIGGCCGTTPGHIAALVQTVRG